MSEELIARWMDDRAGLTEDEAAELAKALAADPSLARLAKDQLAADELLSRRLAVDRRSFENQVVQRIIGAGSDGRFLRSTLEAVRGSRTRPAHWRARLPEAAAAVIVIAALAFFLRGEPAVLPGAAPSVRHGLRAQYYRDRELRGTPVERIDRTIAFDWAAGRPPIDAPQGVFSVRWTGKLTATYSEGYLFLARYDDGIRVWIDGRLILEDWSGRYSVAERKVYVDLVAGRPVDLKIEYFNGGDRGVAQLRWSSSSQSEEIIPESALSPE